MPIWPLNNVQTHDGYVDALTVNFPTGRRSFTLQVYNAAVFYRLIGFEPPNNYQSDATEHFLAPVLAGFEDPANEGIPLPLFGGIMLRSAAAGTPASVTVV